MPTSTIATILPADFVVQIFKTAAVTGIQSAAGMLWTVVTILWSSYWLYILIFGTLWVVWELVTRNGGFHYNSQNGFSPTFNRVVGAGVYMLFQACLYGLIRWIFGDDIYAQIWPYPIHIAVFLLTGLFLNVVGFWVYWKLPF